MSARDPKERVESWEPQFKIPLVVNGKKICDFIPDFFVRYATGRKVLVEIKGMQTETYRLKRKLFEAVWLSEHPDIEYVINP